MAPARTPLGLRIATWLRSRVAAEGIYDDHILLELQPLGVFYDPTTKLLWMQTGELLFMPAYTPAELMLHPDVEIRGIDDPGPDEHSVLGWEVAAALHRLLWACEEPPGNIRRGWQKSYEQDVGSIAARETLPYRDRPPGGWWRRPWRSR